MVFSTSWLFQRTESSGQVIFFYARVAEAPGPFLLVDSLKTSAIDSVTAYIKPQLQVNVLFYELNTQGQNFINVPYT